MIRRIVDQTDFQAGPVGKFDHPTQVLSRDARVLWAVVQINDQASNATAPATDTGPPGLHAVAPEVAALAVAEDERQQSCLQDQHSEGHQLSFRWRVVIETLDYLAVTIGSSFFPPESIHPA